MYRGAGHISCDDCMGVEAKIEEFFFFQCILCIYIHICTYILYIYCLMCFTTEVQYRQICIEFCALQFLSLCSVLFSPALEATTSTVETIVVAQVATLRRYPRLIPKLVRSLETKLASNEVSESGSNRYAFLPGSNTSAYSTIHLTQWNKYISKLEEMELMSKSSKSTASASDPSIEDVAKLADENCIASPNLVRIVLFIREGRTTKPIDLQDSINKLQQCGGGVVRTIVAVMCEDCIFHTDLGFSTQNGAYPACAEAGYCYPRPGRFSNYFYFNNKPYLYMSLVTSGAMWNIGRGKRSGLAHFTELITDDLLSSLTGNSKLVQHPSCSKLVLTT